MTMSLRILGLLPLLVLATACRMDSQEEVLATNVTQLQLRATQSRIFDTEDRATTLRDVVATLQDLSFIVDRADDVIGTVSATRLSGDAIRMTVIVRAFGKRTVVRASAQYNLEAITDPKPYQEFFSALSKSMFLQANKID